MLSFKRKLSWVMTFNVVSLGLGLVSMNVQAEAGDTISSFSTPTQYPSGQAWVRNSLYLLDRGGKQVHKIDPNSGESVFSFPVTHVGDLSGAQNFIWISDPVQDEIIKIDPVDGQVLKTLPSPGIAPAGLAYDGAYLWNVDWMENLIYKLNPVDGSVVDTLPSPSVGQRAFGLTWDGQALWMVDWEDDTIYQVDASDGNVLKSFPAPGPNSQGLAWDGKYLWVSDLDTDQIYKVDSGSDAPGVVGCIEVEGQGLIGAVTVNQVGQPEQSITTEDGCFVFEQIVSGMPVALSVLEEESGEDLLPPVITLVGNAEMDVFIGETFVDPGATALDNVDGELTSAIVVEGSVDTTTVGVYTLTYDVSDNAGNAATQVVRTVNVVEAALDTEAPVITLNGSEIVEVTLGDTYNDAGATATDNIDGDLTSEIEVAGAVDTAVEGSYTLTYDVTDAAGNAATQVSRTVNVVAAADSVAPVISLLGNSEITVEQGTSYVEPGATATDNVDGDISGQIQVSGNVDVNTAGAYVLSYNVTDSAGNPAATVTRTVNVADTIAPVIVVLGDNPMTINQNASFVDPGATASDSAEGNLTSAIVVTGSVNTAVVGTYTRTYSVADNAGNSDQKTRTVQVVLGPDTAAPVITLNGANPMTVEQGTSYSEPGATASDDRDGNLTASITISGVVNVNQAGTYQRIYSVSDAAGNNRTVQRTVIVQDTTKPVITLNGNSTVTVAQYGSYSDAGAIASDNIDGDITAAIVTNNNVNVNVAGTYTVTYNVSDDAGNAADARSRTVNVVFECRDFTATNSAHESAGRAYSETSGWWIFQTTTWYATGSGDNLGTIGSTSRTLSESPEGYYSNGGCN